MENQLIAGYDLHIVDNTDWCGKGQLAVGPTFSSAGLWDFLFNMALLCLICALRNQPSRSALNQLTSISARQVRCASGSSDKLSSTLISSKLLLAAFGCSLLPLAAFGRLWLPLAAFGCLRPPLAAFGLRLSAQFPTFAPSYSQLFLSTLNY